MALARSGMNAKLRGLRDRSVTLLQEGVRIAIQSGDVFSMFYTRQKFFEAARISGQLEAAAGLIEDNLELAKLRGDTWGIANALRLLALVAEDTQDQAVETGQHTHNSRKRSRDLRTRHVASCHASHRYSIACTRHVLPRNWSRSVGVVCGVSQVSTRGHARGNQ
jgi:hypothetical protein